MRLVASVIAGAAVAAVGGLVLGEYPFTGWTPWVAGVLFALVVTEVMISIGRTHGPVVAIGGGVFSAGGLGWAVWISSGRGLEPISSGGWLAISLGFVVAMVRGFLPGARAAQTSPASPLVDDSPTALERLDEFIAPPASTLAIPRSVRILPPAGAPDADAGAGPSGEKATGPATDTGPAGAEAVTSAAVGRGAGNRPAAKASSGKRAASSGTRSAARKTASTGTRSTGKAAATAKPAATKPRTGTAKAAGKGAQTRKATTTGSPGSSTRTSGGTKAAAAKRASTGKPTAKASTAKRSGAATTGTRSVATKTASAGKAAAKAAKSPARRSRTGGR